jgi:hypothetical protein
MFKRIWFTSPNTYFTITQLVKITHVFGHPIRKEANDSGLLGEIVNVSWNAFIKTYCCYWDIREQTRFKTSTSLLGHKNILTTSNYLQDSKRSIQDQLRECLC